MYYWEANDIGHTTLFRLHEIGALQKITFMGQPQLLVIYVKGGNVTLCYDSLSGATRDADEARLKDVLLRSLLK